ncbi:MAG: lytic murein transglycosylase [Candidatus Delongbacteria bacterium]|jgi:membrane-bound lytic murein transglycosylase B|nr:lytic murein transglycosylase [Candidatus Delongbacteria bacterium]
MLKIKLLIISLILLTNSLFAEPKLYFKKLYEDPKFLHEIIEDKLQQESDSLRKVISSIPIGERLLDQLVKKIYLYSADYLNVKYTTTNKIDTLNFVESVLEDLGSSSYFKKRNKAWNNSSLLKYLTFRIEYHFLGDYLRNFDLEEFKDNDIYHDIIAKAKEDSLELDKIDSLLSQVKTLRFDPLHFYYKPNSIKEQQRVDKFDVNKFDFDRLEKFYNDHADVLERTEDEYKVNKEIIIAILRKETNLGKYKLTINPFQVLLGQAQFGILNPLLNDVDKDKQRNRINRLRRSAQRSLYHIIKYCIDNDFKADEIKGNFVGAIGFTQFMPFNLHLAKDGDYDGKADLSNMDDAIISIGNFLYYNGWKKYIPLEKKNKKEIIRQILKYNTSDSYADAIYQIAEKLGMRLE